MVNVPDVSGGLDVITSLVGSYGEGIFAQSLIPALMVALLMLSALSRVWE